jgi:glycosyltransferase involved in cell wall biosynthesis
MEGRRTMIKTLLIGPLFSRSGYGEHARFVFNALSSQSEKFDLHVHPILWGHSSWISTGDASIEKYEEACIKKETYNGEYDLIVQVTIPTEWEHYSKDFKARCVIGITAAVETDVAPNSWVGPCNSVDHIIFTSKHSQSTLTNKKYEEKNATTGALIKASGISTPSNVIGYPVKSTTPENLNDKLPLDTDFNFLSITQVAPRKDLNTLIAAFLEEFKNENVGLVLKAHHANNSEYDRHMLMNGFMGQLKNTEKKCKVYWIHGTMSETEIHGLYSHPDIHAYVTTTHGEGFGLPMFEAAYSGMPVIAPGWSGHLDFLRIPKGKKTENLYERIRCEVKNVHENDQMEGILLPYMKWAYSDLASVRKCMRNVMENIKVKKRTAQRLKDYLHETFSIENQYEQICSTCEEVFTEKDNWTEKTETITIV